MISKPNAPARVLATEAALALLETIKSEHPQILIHLSGGCCDGSSPMCYPKTEFQIGESDVELGAIGDVPVYIAKAQYELWRHTQLILDVVPGRGGMFSLDNGTGQRFLLRGRVFRQDEIEALCERQGSI